LQRSTLAKAWHQHMGFAAHLTNHKLLDPLDVTSPVVPLLISPGEAAWDLV